MGVEAEIASREELIARARQLREKLRNDPHRPAYHFVPPSAWMNDINGSIFWKGRYHTFYQYNPQGAYNDGPLMHWGHASSVDLVHWVHHPIALAAPSWSGNALVSKEGIPTVVYFSPDGICVAVSRDDMLIDWTMDPANPVIPKPKPDDPDFGKYTVHDSFCWLAGDTYYALVNKKPPRGGGDLAFLFKSPDLHHWEFLGPFYQSDRHWTDAEEDCAVPDFFPLGDKHMLLFCSHFQATQYYLGRLENERFYPQTHARMSWPGGQLAGPRTLLDDKGRRIFFDWIREIRGVERERASGWSGVMTLPRILSLAKNGTLCIEPAAELEVLRMHPHVAHGDVRVPGDSESVVDGVEGDCLELAVQITPQDAQEFGVKVRCSADDTEQTAVLCNVASKTLSVDVGQSTLDDSIRYPYCRNDAALERLPVDERFRRAQEAPFELAAGEMLDLRIFIDRSVLEVFANNRQCITQRIYPARSDSVGARLFSTGGAVHVNSLEAWAMAPTHD